jgi:hypothetical protein
MRPYFDIGGIMPTALLQVFLIAHFLGALQLAYGCDLAEAYKMKAAGDVCQEAMWHTHSDWPPAGPPQPAPSYTRISATAGPLASLVTVDFPVAMDHR